MMSLMRADATQLQDLRLSRSRRSEKTAALRRKWTLQTGGSLTETVHRGRSMVAYNVQRGGDAKRYTRLLERPGETKTATQDHIDLRHGTVPDDLTGLGLSSDAQDRLRRRLIRRFGPFPFDTHRGLGPAHAMIGQPEGTSRLPAVLSQDETIRRKHARRSHARNTYSYGRPISHGDVARYLLVDLGFCRGRLAICYSVGRQ